MTGPHGVRPQLLFFRFERFFAEAKSPYHAILSTTIIQIFRPINSKTAVERLLPARSGASIATRRDALQEVVAQNEAALEVVDVGDVDRDALVVDDRELAVGGRLADADL